MKLYETIECHCCNGSGKIKVINPNALRDARIRSGKSLRQVARELDFTPPYISDIELGKRHCTVMVAEYYRKMMEGL